MGKIDNDFYVSIWQITIDRMIGCIPFIIRKTRYKPVKWKRGYITVMGHTGTISDELMQVHIIKQIAKKIAQQQVSN